MLLMLLLLLWPQMVVKHERFSTVESAPTKYQPRDLTTAPIGPYFVLVGENQGFCVVTGDQYASVLDGESFDCRWQTARLTD